MKKSRVRPGDGPSRRARGRSSRRAGGSSNAAPQKRSALPVTTTTDYPFGEEHYLEKGLFHACPTRRLKEAWRGATERDFNLGAGGGHPAGERRVFAGG